MVDIKIVTARGHDTKTLDPASALAEIQDLAKGGKWPFIDGEFIARPQDLTVDRIEAAESITITNQIVGG